MTTLYLTSTNPDKVKAANTVYSRYSFKKFEHVESDSGIPGGQPYGIDETKQGCINRTKQFKNGEDFISIENGFVKETDKEWYDIAYIYMRINGKILNGWSEKRYFPKEMYNNTEKLIKYFSSHSISRYDQINNCILAILDS